MLFDVKSSSALIRNPIFTDITEIESKEKDF
jgi:hypothetical protein